MAAEPISDVERRLGLTWVNTALRGVRSYPGKLLGNGLAIVIFDARSADSTTVALWSLSDGRMVSSENLPFRYSMLWHWDERADMLAAAFQRLGAPDAVMSVSRMA